MYMKVGSCASKNKKSEEQKKSTSFETDAFDICREKYYFFFPFAGPAFAAFAAS